MQQTIVDGRYNVSHPLGSGGMGQVYLAQDEVLGREVALKILWERLAESEEFVERFRREARSVAALSHPNIVSVYDQGRAGDGTYYIAMEHVSGGTLKERIVGEGLLGYREAADVGIQVSEALEAAHSGGVIHRDIKPHNILLTESGEVKVVDFGIARAVSQASMTGTSFILGTAHYLSPEQAKGEPTGPASDLYALGVVLYEMLTGVAPYEAESPIAVALKHVSDPPASPRAANPEVPKGMDAVVVKLLAKDPEDRYADAGELAEDLRRVRRDLSPTALSSPPKSKAAVSRGRAGKVLSIPSIAPPPRQNNRPVFWGRRRLRWLLPVALVLLAVASLITAFGGSGSFNNLYKVSGDLAKEQPKATLIVPKVVGDKKEAAENALREMGFKVKVEEKESKDKEKGRVLSLKPGEGKKAERGSLVSLVVGKGPSMVEVPRLKGLSLAGAEKKLKEANLKLGEKKEAHSDSVQKGDVIEQGVESGKKVKKGEAVGVTVSSGKKKEPKASVQEAPAQAAPAQAAPAQAAPAQAAPAQAAPAPEPVQQAPAEQTQAPASQAPAPAPQPVPAPTPQPAQQAPAPVATPAPPAQPAPPATQPQTTTAPSSAAPAAPNTSPTTTVTPPAQSQPPPGGQTSTSSPAAGGSAQPGVVNVAPVKVPKVVVPEVQIAPVQPSRGKTGGS